MKENKKEALTQFHRTNILQAAEKLFLEKGVENTTVDTIAKAADYSKATLYVYFKNKEEIISSITLVAMQLFHHTVREALSKNTDFIKQYHALCESMVDFQRNYPLYFDSLLKEINVDIDLPSTPKVYQDIFEAGEKINMEIGSLLRKGIEQGHVRTDIRVIETVFIFWAGISGALRMAIQKEAYLSKFIGVTKNEFLQYSFETLLKSITNK
ncbi:MAG: transcriptional regulator TetR family [Herbinix sp.]|jgi:AcrR family transcriptional regulator|nr:transcriptional regulator TetR family [Herbinix sp.]